jgi:hypothetical protein
MTSNYNLTIVSMEYPSGVRQSFHHSSQFMRPGMVEVVLKVIPNIKKNGDIAVADIINK